MMHLQQMDDRVSVHRDWFKDYGFHLVSETEKVKKLVDICVQRGVCSLDCECTGVDNRIYPDSHFDDGIKSRHGIRTIDRIVGLCMSFDGRNGYYLPLTHEPNDSPNLPWDSTWDEITRLIENCIIIFHNSKFDCEFLYPPTGINQYDFNRYEDTLFISKIINPLKTNPNGLKPLTKIHFGVDMVELDELFTDERKEQLKKEGRRYNFALLHPKEGLEYGCSDGIFTYGLLYKLIERLSEQDKKIYNLEKSFCNVVRRMEQNRIHLDIKQVNSLYEECKIAMRETGDAVRTLIEKKTGKTGRWLALNVGSPSQLSTAFFNDQEGLKLKPTPEMISDADKVGDENKQYSTNEEALKSLNKAYGDKFPIIRAKADGSKITNSMFEVILEYRHYEKMKGSYIEPLFKSHDKYGDVRPSFNQIGTDTTRLSGKADKIENGYSGVNFHGIPRDSDDDKPELFKQIRTCIAPRPGYVMVKIDYSGEELRVVTNLSGDRIWIKSFLYEDGDVHSITTRILYGKQDISKDERNRGKRSNFAFIYGGGAGAIQSNVGCSIEDAQRHMNNLRAGVPELMGYVDHQKQFARKYKCIYTAFGRRIPIQLVDSPIKGLRRKAERQAINYTIQATSADILKYAFCFVDKNIRKLGWEDRVKYVLTVHDEIVFEVKPEYLMEIVPKLDEWMTYPWKLPKAHGREWIVPLETEPGVDIHWRARYDFFAMTRGTEVKPDQINEGKYTGKLKKGHYFANGRIYQEIPDFLKSYIKVEGGLPETKQIPEVKPDESKPESKSEVKIAENVPEPPPITPELKEAFKQEAQKWGEEVSEKVADIENLSEPPKVESKPTESEAISTEVDLDVSQEEGLGIEVEDAGDEDEEATKPTNGRKPIGEDEQIFRFTFQAVMSEFNAKKLKAIFALAEGDTPLRIVDPKGVILLPEQDAPRVDPQKFQYLASLYGLG